MPAVSSRALPRLIIVVSAILLLALLVHLAGVAALRYFAERTLHPALPKGTHVGEVHLNLFSGHVKVDDFELRDDDGVRMRFAELDLKVRPWRMLTGEVYVERAVLRRALLRVERLADGSFDLGLPPFGDDAEPQPNDDGIDVTVAGVELDNITIDYRDGELVSSAYVDELTVGTYSSSAAEQQVPVDWVLRWDGQSIDGDAVVSIDDQGVATSGKLQTALLDIGRAQQLARLDPVATGQLSYRGSFAWTPPRLTLVGRVDAPRVDYEAEGRKAELRGLALPAFDVEVSTEPALHVDAQLTEPAELESADWQADGQVAEVSTMRLAGTLSYDAAGIVADALDLGAARVAWRDGGRELGADAVALNGSLRHAIGDAAPPTLNATASARVATFADNAQALTVELADVAISKLSLQGDALDSTARLGAGKLSQASNTVTWSQLAADVAGKLAEAPDLSAKLGVDQLGVSADALPNGSLSVSRIDADGLGVGDAMRFDRLRFRGIALPAQVPEAALAVAALTLNEGSYSDTGGVAIGEIVVDGVQTGVIRDKLARWRHAMTLRAQAIAAGEDPDAGSEAPPWRVGGISVVGDSHITVVDRTNPDMQPIRYSVEKIEIGAMDSVAPTRNTPFAVTLRPDEYSEFQIAGDMQPLAKPIYLQAKGHLQGFGLSSVNGLVANDLGHRFIEGQLDDEFSITIDKQHVDMSNALQLAGLVVEAIEGKEGPPLGTAIALLEDRDGNIKLEVPVTGDLTDPKFRVLGALNPIIMKAVAGTAALAIQPLGSVLLVGGLLADQALKVTFKPALFKPGSTELDRAARKYLDDLAGKLKEKPKLALRLCGVAITAERKKNKQGKFADKPGDVLPLAQQRADAARKRLLRAGVGAKQLRRCRPRLDAKQGAKARVDIRL